MNKLEAYCKQRNWSPKDLAQRLGVHRNSVHRYLRGDRRPDWEVLERLRILTKGKVSANDFIDKPHAEVVEAAE
jgi:transcriptional regulator with XRE-family HTH domain